MSIIKMKEWLNANERAHVLPTDKWYLDFTIALLPLIKKSPLFAKASSYDQRQMALLLGLYLQDSIAQTGGWKDFSNLYNQLYGTPLPFYTVTDEYIPDEINREDIAFLLWTHGSQAALWEDSRFSISDPFDKDLLALSEVIYNAMDACFEEAPICNEPSIPFWVMEVDLLEVPSTPLPEITADTKLSKDAMRSLEYSQGKSLLYFATYQELCQFFVDVLGWENKPASLLSDLKYKKEFVVYPNAKGLLVAHGVAAYFNDPHNPLYNAERAAAEAYTLFCQYEFCPFDLLKYAMKHHLLSEAQFPFPHGKEILHRNWDFIARYFLCECYEGE